MNAPRLRDEIYTSASLEKTARAAEFSAIKRALSKDNIVIADGLNYIKGYRYQLWCEAKAAETRCCVVHVATTEEQCRAWNADRATAWGRDQEGDVNEKGDEGKKKEGENILGDFVPESHTNIYGDRVVEKVDDVGSRSRSSSMDGGTDDVPRTMQTDETMTLKSLYMNPQAGNTSPSQPTTRYPAPLTNSTSDAQPSIPLPTIPPPSPNSSPPYAPQTLTSLSMRYEPPSPFSRWDTPLFTVPSSDLHPPTPDIWNALYPQPIKPMSKKALSQIPRHSTQENGPTTNTAQNQTDLPKENAVKPHAATVAPKPTSADALQTLESATMDVVKHLLAQSRLQPSPTTNGDINLSIPLPNSNPSTVDVSLHIPSNMTLSQPLLQRLRRKYTQIQRGGIAHGQGYVQGRRSVVEGFVEFLEREWEEEE